MGVINSIHEDIKNKTKQKNKMLHPGESEKENALSILDKNLLSTLKQQKLDFLWVIQGSH